MKPPPMEQERLEAIKATWAQVYPCPGSWCSALTWGQENVPALIAEIERLRGEVERLAQGRQKLQNAIEGERQIWRKR